MKVTSALLLPLLLAIFTVVITFEQKADADKQRFEDRELAQKQRQQDLNQSILSRENDRTIADAKRLADDLNAEKQRNMSRELEESRYKQERHRYFDELLVSYLNDIGQLLKENNGSLTSNPAPAALARAKTLQIAPHIGPVRVAQLIHFLYDAGQLTREKNPLDVSGAYFHGVDLSTSSLRHISLVGAYMNNSSFTGQDVSEGDFHNTHLNGADFSKANCTNTSFSEATMIDANFSQAILHLATFSHVQLIRANFSQTNFTNIMFESANMMETDFSHTSLFSIKFSKVDLAKAKFNAATISSYYSYVSFFQSNMQHTNFSKSYIPRSRFVECSLIGADFREVELFRAYFEYCDIDYVNFTGSQLESATFNRSSLAFTALINTRLEETIFPFSELSYANLSGACCYECGKQCNSGCEWRNILARHNIILCNGTIYRDNSIVRSHLIQNNTSVKNEWDEVSFFPPVVRRLYQNNSYIYVLKRSEQHLLSHLKAYVNISRFREFIRTGDAAIAVRARMSSGMKVLIGDDILQFHRTTSDLIQAKWNNLPLDKNRFDLDVVFDNTLTPTSLWLNYIEIGVVPRSPRL
ncbi:unnamed protein product [Rotaria sp. Silwood1]|nr:unnamed protein product [Rotaria sp. Silwood1]CAF1682758.1 unnamed protein product [Rotaria sp. Silwood1]